eukprot:COSAG01_NODE_56963_length_315_cov_0.740741_1_plen_81_part_01
MFFRSISPLKKEPGAVSGVPHGPVPPQPFPPCAPPAPPSPPPSGGCDTRYLGCFREVVPAPGVPPIRALTHKIAGCAPPPL